MLGDVVGAKVGVAQGPVDGKLFLVYAVADPVEMHVDGF